MSNGRIDLSPKRKTIKCIVWDLDGTIWDGILLEDKSVSLREGVIEIIRRLDKRGILHSIASRNDFAMANGMLEQLGLVEYFLYPQIGWNPKSASITAIAASLNIAVDNIAFVDDQQFELEEVQFSLPQVLCIHVRDVNKILQMPEMNPESITEDSKNRRQLYKEDIERKKVESEFAGTNEEFLASLNMVFTIAHATREDLRRAEELTVRTNQLNSTGIMYSVEELETMLGSSTHMLLIASLEDRFGTYGKIGLSLIECLDNRWTIKLLLMSCRVISRGVGTILLNHIIGLAREKDVKLQAHFISNERNRLMYIAYKFAGFAEVGVMDNRILLENDLANVQPLPNNITVNITN